MNVRTAKIFFSLEVRDKHLNFQLDETGGQLPFNQEVCIPLPKWQILTHACIIQNCLGQKTSFEMLRKCPPMTLTVTSQLLENFLVTLHNMSQAPSKCLKQRIKVDKLDYFK